MNDRDEARERRHENSEAAKIAFINLASPHDDKALAAGKELLTLVSGEDTFTSVLAVINEERANALKAVRKHALPEIRDVGGKVIEWVNAHAMGQGISAETLVNDPDAGIDRAVSIRAAASEVRNRFFEKSGSAHTPPLEDLRGDPAEDALLAELRQSTIRPKSVLRDLDLIRNIQDAGVITNAQKHRDQRALAATELTKTIEKATDPELFDIMRIVEVPSLRNAGSDQDETISRPVQALMTSLAIKVSTFFGISPSKAAVDPTPVLDALHEMKAATEAEPGLPGVNLRQAMIARRNNHKMGTN